MKYLFTILIGAALNYALFYVLPFWWAFAPFAFIYFLLLPQTSGWRNFSAGFLMLFLPWLLAYIIKDAANDHVLSARIAAMFSMSSGIFLFVIISGIMGLISGLSANAAYFLRKK
ncbi:MAG: hypothetical protein R2794_04495 [Chitinophagales bacterium]